MPIPPAHAKPRAEGLIAAWLCLIIAGAATVTFNISHALHSGMATTLGVVEGLVPVALAMVVSHLVATSRAGKFLKTVTFAVMIGAMALSVRATGAVVEPAAGSLWWLFGAVVDTAALVALQVLLSLQSRAAQIASERAQSEAAAADERVTLRAQIAAAQAALAPAIERAENAERAAAEAAATADELARKLAAADAKNARSRASRKRAAAPRSATAQERATKVPDDVDARAEALSVLAAEPDISGAQLGPRVGMSKRWGQDFKRGLATAAPKGQDPEDSP
jgi:hypothetical protein